MARSSRLESGFQDRLKKDIEIMFPGSMVFKMEQRQGIPDLLILYGDRWASLECKKEEKACDPRRQGQRPGVIKALEGDSVGSR